MELVCFLRDTLVIFFFDFMLMMVFMYNNLELGWSAFTMDDYVPITF